MTAPGLILAAPASGSGKTVTVLALLRHFRRAGIAVASRKVGPDYIDPMFHTAASGRPCINLDPWAMRPETLAGLAQRERRPPDRRRRHGPVRRRRRRHRLDRRPRRPHGLARSSGAGREVAGPVRRSPGPWLRHLPEGRDDFRRHPEPGRQPQPRSPAPHRPCPPRHPRPGRPAAPGSPSPARPPSGSGASRRT